VKKITFLVGKINKNRCHRELHFLTPICTKPFVGWGFAPDPTGGAYSAPPDAIDVLTGLLLKEGQGEEAWRRGKTSGGR